VIPTRPQRAGLSGIYVVWALFFLAAVAVFETYWRLPPSETWKVHNTGFVGGAGRAFVFLSFSCALAAIAVLPIVVDRLDSRLALAAGVVAFLLCATVAIPGVQTQSHLDPKWANLPAVLGVALAFVLTLWASRSGRRERTRTTRAGDRARLAVGGVSLFFAAPYIAAELGFFLDGVPLLGWIFLTGAKRPEPGSGYVHAAVHHGHHHGLDGFLLATTALLFSRLVGGIRRPLLRTVTAVYLSLLLVYALTNQAQDLWTEQVVKRGWTNWDIPDVLEPKASAAWAAMIACGLAVYALFLRQRRGQRLGLSTSSIHSDIGT
jgi:hypothetical protein